MKKKSVFVTAILLLFIAGNVFAQAGVSAEMVRIDGGTFTMGSPANEKGSMGVVETQHQVTVNSFYMGNFPVTQKEWSAVMGTTVKQKRDMGDKSLPLVGEGDNLPMYYVSWFDAVEYCNKLSAKEGLTPAYTIDKNTVDPNNLNDGEDSEKWLVIWNQDANGYRLPTEAEWEYACRAGTTTAYNTGAKITNKQANFKTKKVTPVDKFAPNAWGLYDMHGNVAEWCWDWWGMYTADAQTNPTGAPSGYHRVIRGGSWYVAAEFIRSAVHGGFFPASGLAFLGFRVVRNIEK